jgi:hypothetical protein
MVCIFYVLYLLLIILIVHSFVVPDNSTQTESPLDVILGIVNYYVLIGFISIFFYWMAWSCWILAAERQVRRMRFVIIRLEKNIFK